MVLLGSQPYTLLSLAQLNELFKELLPIKYKRIKPTALSPPCTVHAFSTNNKQACVARALSNVHIHKTIFQMCDWSECCLHIHRSRGPGCGPASQGLWFQCDFLWPLFGWWCGKIPGTAKGHYATGNTGLLFMLVTHVQIISLSTLTSRNDLRDESLKNRLD